jgi:hypothetical protein
MKSLSKSQFVRGLQCVKSLWLYRHRKDLRTAPEAFQESIMEAGTEFGALARQRWPGGVLIAADHMHPEDALAQTKAALDAGANILYEAAFLFDDVLVRVDVMERVGPPSAGNLWVLYEVKSGTKVEEVHLSDVAIQRHVLKGAGHEVVKAFVVHANPAYVRHGDLDLHALFALEDVTNMSALLSPGVVTDLANMKKHADAEAAPAVSIGDRCKKPYPCEFKAHCWAGVPEYSVFDIPYLKGDKKLELYSRGVQHVHQVNPELAKITDKRSLRAIEVARSGKVLVDLKAVRTWLDGLVYPLAHLDFETDNPVVPPFDLLRPYSQMPFQASVRIQEELGGKVVEQAFLGDGAADPRARLAEFLADVTPRRGSVLAYYKPFEEGRIAELAFPGVVPAKLQKPLLDIQGRLQDLADPFSKGWYTSPAFNGRWSIKAVLPALCPDMSYKTLLIQDGGQAMAAYAELRDPKTTPERRRELEAGLRAYCGQDTQAMVRILAHLYEVVGGQVAA